MLWNYIKENAKRRPTLAIKLAIMLVLFIITFIYVEISTPSENKWIEFCALLGGALVGVGIDAFIIYFERWHYVCEDI